MDIIIIGAGMYVTGRGTDGFGTILPSVLKWIKLNDFQGNLRVVATSSDSIEYFKQVIKKLSKLYGMRLPDVIGYPNIGEEKSQEIYKKALSDSDEGVVIISVPDHLHFTIVKESLLSGKHVLVVKPLAPTLHEGIELATLAKEQGLYAAVEFHKRFDRSNRMLRDRYESGVLGEPITCLVEYSQRRSIPLQTFSAWVEKTSILQYLGVHYIDIARFVTGAVPVKVMAIGQKTILNQEGVNAYDSIQCTIVWNTENGTRFTQVIMTSWVDPEKTSAMSEQRIKFTGSRAIYDSDQKNRGIEVVNEDSLECINPDFCQPYKQDDNSYMWEGYGVDSVVTFLSDVNKIFEGVLSPEDLDGRRPTFKESLWSTAVLEAASKSLENDSLWVDIDMSGAGI